MASPFALLSRLLTDGESPTGDSGRARRSRIHERVLQSWRNALLPGKASRRVEDSGRMYPYVCWTAEGKMPLHGKIEDV